jgi:hypothetical protein
MGSKRMPSGYMKSIEQRAEWLEDKPKSKSKKKVHAVSLAAQLNLFGGKPLRFTLCKRRINHRVLISSNPKNVTCKRCLRKLAPDISQNGN